jgi:hypothetical protein
VRRAYVHVRDAAQQSTMMASTIFNDDARDADSRRDCRRP